MTEFKIGQKWISNAEPELAMGQITQVDPRTISMLFDITAEQRTYARAQAPLTRVKFNQNDQITTRDGLKVTVSSVHEKQGLYIYHGEYQGTSTAIIETELDPNVRFSKPQDRLFTNQLDQNAAFNLRYQTLHHLSRLAAAKCRGLYGPRVSPIPHQLYIASEVANRFAPRVLLADEVGLGKTIEAGLIIHQQLQTGRASRVLVIVPPALTFQWFVEMIRRFNLQFTVLDEARLQNIVSDNSEHIETNEAEPCLQPEQQPEQQKGPQSGQAQPNTAFNPFDGQQLMLCSLDLFSENAARLEQVVNAEWDLVVVDEAHHLAWSETAVSDEYKIIERIAKVADGLLLLTATPEQLGKSGHFARLKLLDPSRFHDYAQFSRDEQQFESVAEAANQLLEGSQAEQIQARAEIAKRVNLQPDDPGLIDALLDRHGTGRVLFRNVRSNISGFPQRLVYPVALELPEQYQHTKSLFPHSEVKDWTLHDPRIAWILELLADHQQHKFLLICAHQATAIALGQRLNELVATAITLFHEGMDLIARDRAANYFAESEYGAQMMICSEIGSEGRNFQFASHLILFDLPFGPDLLEQRIGRLDRIGQRNDVNIHIPYFINSPTERLFEFFHAGVRSFTAPNPVAQSIFDELFAVQFMDLSNREMASLIEHAQTLNQQRLQQLNKGRDRLLELNSHRPEVSANIVSEIKSHQGGDELETYMESSFDLFGLESEISGDNVITIKPTEAMSRHSPVSAETMDHFHYPELPEDGIRVTYDLDTALAREDVAFFSWENPVVQQALDMAIADVTGNSTMIAVKHPNLSAGTLLVEVLHVVDCAAPKKLMADRYLPPRLIRSLIDPNLKDQCKALAFQPFIQHQLEIPDGTLIQILGSQQAAIKPMIETAIAQARKELDGLKSTALAVLNLELKREIVRLSELKKINDSVRSEEITHLQEDLEALTSAINHADVRMDAIRVIVAA
ncbi:MAG: RNA polymerase-associated protein RapA [Pseudomonadales bacterium]|nr:RNA polymerase-associated protein RapA [Pseudomonadales bacterium]